MMEAEISGEFSCYGGLRKAYEVVVVVLEFVERISLERTRRR
jgi:hypothetical protein